MVGRTSGFDVGPTTVLSGFGRAATGGYSSLGGEVISSSPIPSYDLAINANNVVALAYAVGSAPSQVRYFSATLNAPGAGWGPSGPPEHHRVQSTEPTVAVDPSDNITVAWTQDNPNGPSVVSRTRLALNGNLTQETAVTPAPPAALSDPTSYASQVISTGDGALTLGYLEKPVQRHHHPPCEATHADCVGDGRHVVEPHNGRQYRRRLGWL